MDWQEIHRHIHLGKTNSISIEKKLLSKYPGIVRELSLGKDNRLTIRFYDRNLQINDEAEVQFYLIYADSKTWIHSLEAFCGRSMCDWKNENNIDIDFPDQTPDALEDAWVALKTDFANGQLDFPSGGIKLIVPDPCWKAIMTGKLKPNASYEEIRIWAKEYFASE